MFKHQKLTSYQHAILGIRHIDNEQVSNRMSFQGSHIIACIDGSVYTDSVCDYAAWAAKSTDNAISLLNISQYETTPTAADIGIAVGLGTSNELYNELSDVERDRIESYTNNIKCMLENSKMRILSEHINKVEAIQLTGNFKETLVNYKDQIELLIVGVRGQGHVHSRSGIGNHLAPIIRSLHKPVLVVTSGFSTPQKIMLAYDASSSANKALDFLCQSPLFRHQECHLVAVDVEGKSYKASVEKAQSRLSEAGMLPITTNLQGKVWEQLLTYQKKNAIDLTIMGAFSHIRIRDFFVGSLTTKMLTESNVPLLLVR